MLRALADDVAVAHPTPDIKITNVTPAIAFAEPRRGRAGAREVCN